MQKINYLFLLLLITSIFSCKKETPYSENPGIVRVEFAGYIMMDTLEFVKNGVIIGQAIDNSFTILGSSQPALFKAGEKVIVRKKADGKTVGTFDINLEPFAQKKKLFYDGENLTDNLVLTPVSDPNNYGFQIQFSTVFSDFYGGPVDVEFFEKSTRTARPRVTTYTSVRLLQGVTGKFGEFIELPLPVPEDGKTKSYVFKVYKAGTNELPYTKMDNVDIADPDGFYGNLDVVFQTPGESILLSISPTLMDVNGNTGLTGTTVIADYITRDFAFAFR